MVRLIARIHDAQFINKHNECRELDGFWGFRWDSDDIQINQSFWGLGMDALFLEQKSCVDDYSLQASDRFGLFCDFARLIAAASC